MKEKIEVTLLIPALNEEKTLEIVIKKAQKWLKINQINGEILISDNNSIDKTKEIAIKNNARVVQAKERGYGNALKKGIQEAKGIYIIMGDADDSYNFLEISGFYNALKEGKDLVIGNRYNYIEKGAMKWSHKYIGTPLLSYIIRKKYKTNLKDINCGLRGFNREKILKLSLSSNGMEFASEMIIKATQANLKIIEIPINFYKDKRNTKSHIKTVKDGLRHIKLILKKYEE